MDDYFEQPKGSQIQKSQQFTTPIQNWNQQPKILDLTKPEDRDELIRKGELNLTVKDIKLIEQSGEYQKYEVSFCSSAALYLKNILWKFTMKWYSDGRPPLIEFNKRLQHQSIVPGTGKMCLLELSDTRWRKLFEPKPISIINMAIEKFLLTPNETEYPVDLSIVDLFQCQESDYRNLVESLGIELYGFAK